MSSSSKSGNPADAMWEAMEQIRSEFTKRVGPRMGRGDVRAAVLALLQEEPMHGYQIIREIGERTNGRWKPSAGSVYPTLQLLADEGLVTSKTENDRKVYSLTAEAEAEATVAAASAPWAQEAKEDGHFGPVPKAGVDLAQAAAQAARTGTADQQREVADLLDNTRRKIYSILAQD